MNKTERLADEFMEIIELCGPVAAAELMEKYEKARYGWCSDKETAIIIYALIGAHFCGDLSEGIKLYRLYKNMQQMKKADIYANDRKETNRNGI